MNKHIINTICILGLILGLCSCKDFGDMNVDPNNASTTHPQFQLTKIQWNAFRDFGGTGPLYANKMLVQTDGENANQYYKWARGSFEAYGNLRDVTKMMEEAERIEDNRYIALAKFFRAYYFYNLTLTFGDIPYSDALHAEKDQTHVTPFYDEQKQVFKGILKELAEANDLLKSSEVAIEGDIIYDKSVVKWRKLVNVFRMKVLLTLSKRTGDSEFNVVSSFASIVGSEPIFASEADDAQLVFKDQDGNRYPEFNSSSFGSGMYMDSTFIQRLQERQDPRLFVFSARTKLAKENGKAVNDFSAYEGGDPAAPYAQVNTKATLGKVSKVNERYYSEPTTEPRVLIGFAEQEFILAEAVVRGWISGDAKLHYDSGVKASFKFYESNTKEYKQYFTDAVVQSYLERPLTRFSNSATTEVKLEQIMMQKYLQSFFQSGWTSFYDHLRTGYPSFRRPAGVSVPFRWIYPQSEYNYNSANVSEAIRRQFGEGKDLINQPTWWIK
ncbi:SusD-like starch-binding protein associating with outer membrane [Arcticibacter tournemirensis]|uniref:SusD/RagB family nutrient-binding outer membrane lipoprotein n=1 Tax=Arcticibacter tournemirensis TaxID=699437 RepID=A0A5M9HHJ6_9SPHI|nr:SusD/RagB family nutrient-binding outer membrane lipoprotein [Arcticibacter tournemirensis]KAA8485933.1 SusD/RagB family nutrient-binding outer membrane lipoprotein [Arcticibacter tournemirensis]TQM46808.1 SusD-like starch-binding protein associating with outer membrane [Arcticibacter tournemirensis]